MRASNRGFMEEGITMVSLKKPIIGQGKTVSERFSISGGLGFYRIQRQ